jgi:hypothetical protein
MHRPFDQSLVMIGRSSTSRQGSNRRTYAEGFEDIRGYRSFHEREAQLFA